MFGIWRAPQARSTDSLAPALVLQSHFHDFELQKESRKMLEHVRKAFHGIMNHMTHTRHRQSVSQKVVALALEEGTSFWRGACAVLFNKR